MVLALGAVLVAALVARHSISRAATRRLAIVAAVALSVRVLAVTIIYLIAIRSHSEGTWLSDEASFGHAVEALIPNPLDTPLPQGLGHLGGNPYLGLITAMGVAFGHMDTVAFRLTNATLGTIVALVVCMLAAAFFGNRAAVVAGLVAALWPTMVFWSATMLRDTLGSFVVVALWWTLVSQNRLGQPRTVAVVVLALVLLGGLRPYLAGAAAVGVCIWAALPWLRRQSRRTLVVGGLAAVLVVGGAGLQLQRQISEAAHELVYRQMTTRMETLGLLYHDQNPNTPPIEPPFGPGAPVALVDTGSGWLLTGLVQDPLGPGLVSVAFTDGSTRNEHTSDLVLLQSAPLSPWQLVANMAPGAWSFLTGAGGTGDSSSLAWIAEALVWNVLLVVAVVGGIRARQPLREWVFPACVILGTVAALMAVPGAPGNDDRHRSTQTVPLLVVFAAGLLSSRARTSSARGLAVSKATSSPARAGTAVAS